MAMDFGGASGNSLLITVKMDASGVAVGSAQAIKSIQDLGAALRRQVGENDNAPNSIRGSMSGMQQVFQGAMGLVERFSGGLMNAINPLALFHTHVMRLVEVMGLWRIFEYGSRVIRELVDNIAGLPVTMERTEASWKYVFGMMPTANPSENMGVATGISHSLAAWSAQYSYNIPYTRQEEMTAINMMGQTGLNAAGVKQFMPVLADLAATAGSNAYGQPVGLQQAAFAIMDANMGLTRSLKLQLHINPEDLYAYGFDPNNPQMTLWPALKKYADAKHRTGAAQDIAQNTWFGASSSWQDRLQNFALDVGGYPAWDSGDTKAGDLRTGSPFDVARLALINLNKWWDENNKNANSPLREMGAFLSDTLGKGMKDAIDGLQAFAKGVEGSGVINAIKDTGQAFAQWISDPQMQASLQGMAKSFGNAFGSGARSLTETVNNVTNNINRAFGDGSGQPRIPTTNDPYAGLMALPLSIWAYGANTGGTLTAGAISAYNVIDRLHKGDIPGALGAFGNIGSSLMTGAAGGADILGNWMGFKTNFSEQMRAAEIIGGYDMGQFNDFLSGNLMDWLGGILPGADSTPHHRTRGGRGLDYSQGPGGTSMWNLGTWWQIWNGGVHPSPEHERNKPGRGLDLSFFQHDVHAAMTLVNADLQPMTDLFTTTLPSAIQAVSAQFTRWGNDAHSALKPFEDQITRIHDNITGILQKMGLLPGGSSSGGGPHTTAAAPGGFRIPGIPGF